MRGLTELFFGRGREMRRLDDALRAAGLHARLVPDAVKLATLKLIREAGHEVLSDPRAAEDAAQLIAYCMLGHEAYASESGDAEGAMSAEARIRWAVEAGDSLDARIVLLTLHARVIQPDVVARFGLEAE